MSKHIDIVKQFVDNHTDLIIIFDPSYRILFVNNAYCTTFGKQYEVLKGSNFMNLILETDRDMVKASLQKITSLNNFATHQERVSGLAGIKWFEWKVQGRFDTQGKLLDYFAVGRDITEQKKLQEELELLQSRHEQAELIGGVGNWEYDIIRERFWASIGAKKLYGIPLGKQELTTDYIENCIPNRENVHQALEDMILDNKPYDLEFEIQPLDQKERRVIISKAVLNHDATGNPIKIVGVIQDVTRRKLAETKLKDSEELYRNLIKLASEAIYLVNRKGEVIEVNDHACTLLGYSRDELLNMQLSDIDKNYTLETFLDFWKDHGIGTAKIIETTHTHKDGHQIAVEVSGSICKIQEEIVYFGLARDITERKQVEAQLQASEERFKLAVEGTHDGLWDWNIQTGDIYHSERFTTMLGYEPGELPNTIAAWRDLLHPDDVKKALLKVEEYLAGKTNIYKSTFRMLCKDGYYRWIIGRGKAIWDESGKPYRFIGFNTDITTRKNSEREYIKSQENYHRLYDTLTEGVVFFNKDKELIDANPAAQKILNLDLLVKEELNARFYNFKKIHEDGSLFSEEDLPVSLSLQQGEYCHNVIMGVIDDKKNDIVWLSINSAPIYDDDSDLPSGAYIIFSDITAKKWAEDELKKTNETLLAAQDMAKIGCWTYDIKTGNLTWSKQMYTIFGIDPAKEAPNYEQHRDLIHSDDWEMFDESAKKCQLGEPNNLRLKINFPDGSTHHIISLGFPRYNDKGEINEIYGTTQDITEFIQKEMELELHRNHLEQLVQQRTEELEKQNQELRHYHELFIGREFRIKELKNEIEILKQEILNLRSR
ncbi:MAG: PAS domain S-box protein [Candidatus Cloacimonetes bacterium]|nr:PAS domain S-box protein [Candidatus Cloacimonadota bacterium]